MTRQFTVTYLSDVGREPEVVDADGWEDSPPFIEFYRAWASSDPGVFATGTEQVLRIRADQVDRIEEIGN